MQAKYNAKEQKRESTLSRLVDMRKKLVKLLEPEGNGKEERISSSTAGQSVHKANDRTAGQAGLADPT